VNQKPLLEDVMAFIKPAALPQVQPGAPPAPTRDSESVLTALHGALARVSD
jgi:hypothetical protein